ncbi:MAG TPA: L-ribulose-5-phosphate 3-epimerase [Clostridia bacterium]|nr:L-ribulose-5-phosphate 3-epimerase [Clostridia bacterium]
MICFLGLYEKSMPDTLSWREKLLLAKASGFDSLEISIDESDMRLARLDSPKKERYELLAISRDTGVYIDTMCLSGHRKYPLGSSIPEIQKRSMEIMEKAIEFAYDIGIRIIQLAGYDVYYDEVSTSDTRKRFLENLRISAKMAAKYGVILALETMENDFCNTIEKAMYFVREVNSPYLKVYPDMGNVTNGTNDVVHDILQGSGHIAAAHLKETLPGVFRNLKFGQGHVDFKTVTDVLKSIGVTRYTAEFWYDGGSDYAEQLKKAHDFLRPYLTLEG